MNRSNNYQEGSRVILDSEEKSRIVKGLILSFFGDYIENLDKDKLSVAVSKIKNRSHQVVSH